MGLVHVHPTGPNTSTRVRAAFARAPGSSCEPHGHTGVYTAAYILTGSRPRPSCVLTSRCTSTHGELLGFWIWGVMIPGPITAGTSPGISHGSWPREPCPRRVSLSHQVPLRQVHLCHCPPARSGAVLQSRQLLCHHLSAPQSTVTHGHLSCPLSNFKFPFLWPLLLCPSQHLSLQILCSQHLPSGCGNTPLRVAHGYFCVQVVLPYSGQHVAQRASSNSLAFLKPAVQLPASLPVPGMRKRGQACSSGTPPLSFLGRA